MCGNRSQLETLRVFFDKPKLACLLSKAFMFNYNDNNVQPKFGHLPVCTIRENLQKKIIYGLWNMSLQVFISS